MNVQLSTNDNVAARTRYLNEAECLPYMSAARYLIDHYVSAYWKRNRNDPEYVSMELTLCRYLLADMKDPYMRKVTLKWLARMLNINPIVLYNDPDLPF